MAGSPNKSIEISRDGETAGYVQVRFLDYTKLGEPRYSWIVRDSDVTAIDGGQDLTLEAGANPSASQAVTKLMDELLGAGRSFDYEQLSGEFGTWRDHFEERCAGWASDNLDGLEAAIADLGLSAGL